MMLKKFTPFLFFLIIATSPAPLKAQPTPEPDQFVRILFDLLRTTMAKTDTQSEQQVQQYLVDLYFLHFDSRRIAGFVLGKIRRQATPEQQQQFERDFPYFLFRLFYPQVNRYFSPPNGSGKIKTTDDTDTDINPNAAQDGAANNLKILTVREINRDTLVNAQFNNDTNPIPLSVRLRAEETQWRVLDIEIAGVSMLLTQRDVISGMLQKHRYDLNAFLEEINQYT